MDQSPSTCQNCGARLAPGSKFCEQCGAPAGQPTPPPPQYSTPAQPPSYQAPSPQPVIPPSPPQAYVPPQPYSPPPRRSGVNTCLIIALVLLFLCLCLAVLGFILFRVAGSVIEEKFNEISQTIEVPFVTAQPTIELPDPSDVFPQQPSGTEPFFDDFTDTSTGWEVGDDGSASWGYENNAYFITIEEAQSLYWVLPPIDFAANHVEFDVYAAEDYTANTFGSYGAICYYVDSNNFHFVEVDASTQAVYVGKYENGDLVTLSSPEWITASNLKPGSGDLNHIQVSCLGEAITLYINDQLEVEIIDEAVPLEGTVGIFAATYDGVPAGGFKVFFDNFSAWSPQQ